MGKLYAAVIMMTAISIGAADKSHQKAEKTSKNATRFQHIAELESSRMKKRCEHLIGSCSFLYPEERVIECDDVDKEITRLIAEAKKKIVKGRQSPEDVLEKNLPEYLASSYFENMIRLVLYSENEETIKKERDTVKALINKKVYEDQDVQSGLKRQKELVKKSLGQPKASKNMDYQLDAIKMRGRGNDLTDSERYSWLKTRKN